MTRQTFWSWHHSAEDFFDLFGGRGVNMKVKLHALAKDVCIQGRAYNLVDMERTETRIDRVLVEQARRRARREGRGESDIIEDALRRYLAEEATFGEILDGVAAWQREHGVESLSEEEAMKLAVSEQHASRRSPRGE